jgi:hypothetical protein
MTQRTCSLYGCGNPASTLLAFDTTPAEPHSTYLYLWHCDAGGHWRDVSNMAPPEAEYAYSDNDTSLT